MGKDSHSKQQKRKARLEKRAKRLRTEEALAYHGKKYRRDDLIPIYYRTELGILEAYISSDRTLVDNDVVEALQTLIGHLRSPVLPSYEDPDSIEDIMEFKEEFLISSVRRQWESYFHTNPRCSKEDLVGVLRTTLGSIEIWTAQGPGLQGYLRYIESQLLKPPGGGLVRAASGVSPTFPRV